MGNRKLDHASIRIQSLEQSRKFYEDVLGLQPLPRPDFGFPGKWYGLGEGQLHLIQNDGKMAGHIDPTAPHFAIAVDDFGALRQKLKDAGLETLDFGGEQMWVLDPDGNTVELRAPEPRAK